jgi:hypothetical protein
MSDQPNNSDQPAPPQAQPDQAAEVDLEALTLAVERLLRRDLAIERERLNGGARPDQQW